MLKNIFIIGFFITLNTFAVQAQAEINPVKWSLSIKNTSKSPNKGEVLNAVLKADIERGWHLYAMEKVEGGPIATRITIVDEFLFELGKIEAPKPFESEDTTFGTTTKFYEDSVKFSLTIKVLQSLDTMSTKLKIKIRFQTCNKEMCLAPRTVMVESNL